MSCHVCQTEKALHHAQYDELNAIDLPVRKWAQVFIDFVTKLPNDGGLDAVRTIVDRATKMCHFVPCTTGITAAETGPLYWNNIGRLHG